MFFFFLCLFHFSFSRITANANSNLPKCSQIILQKTIFNDEDCANLNDTYINVDVTIDGCQSINKKISFISTNQKEGNTIQIRNSFFDFDNSISTPILVFQGTAIDVFNVTIKLSSDGQFFSSPIFEFSDLYGSNSPVIESLTFYDFSTTDSVFKLSNYPDLTFKNLIFEGKNFQCKSIIEGDSNSSIYFDNCNFSNFNEKSTIFELNYIEGEIHFSSCNFKENKCSLFYLNENNLNGLTFDDCAFFDNNATDILSFVCLIGNQTPEEKAIFNNCQFYNNYIYQKEKNNSYGMIVGLSVSLQFEGTNKFTNCHSIDSDNYGGAITIIHVDNNKYELFNCSFDNCSATKMGGGLFSCRLTEDDQDENEIILHVTNCNFTGCFSYENGGGLSCGHSFASFSFSGQTELRISSSLFKECKSPIGGGIFFKDQTKIGFEQTAIQDTTFDNCQGKNGTAFYIRSDYFSLMNSQIINHYSESQITDFCTALFYLDTAHMKTSVKIKETTFLNNSGQSIEINSPSTTQMATINSFENCQFINNNQFSEKFTLINCEHVQASFNGIVNCSFINNKGRCIYSEMIYGSLLTIGYSKFIGNCGPNGCCLCVYSDSLEENELGLENNIWINNTINSDSLSKIHGGALSIRNVEIETDGLNEFKDNKIISQNIENVEFDASGSALFIELNQSKSITLSNFKFDNCFALKNGGAVFILSSISDKKNKIEITNCVFTNNENKKNGGALFIETKGSTSISIENSYFDKNSALNGGSIFIKETSISNSSELIEISSSQFFNDEADQSGGSIYLSVLSKATIQSNNFTQTKAKIHGMVISFDFMSHVVFKNNNLYIEKEFPESSAIYAFDSSDAKSDIDLLFEINGGCFTSRRKSSINASANYLIYNVSQASNLTITNDACFQDKKEDSISIIGNNTSFFIDDSVFNCDKCDGFEPAESETETQTDIQPTTISQTEEQTTTISSSLTEEQTTISQTEKPTIISSSLTEEQTTTISSSLTEEQTTISQTEEQTTIISSSLTEEQTTIISSSLTEEQTTTISSSLTEEPTTTISSSLTEEQTTIISSSLTEIFSSQTQSTDDDDDGSHKKLGAGTIIGIVLGVFTFVCLIVIAIYIFVRRKNNFDENLLGSYI